MSEPGVYTSPAGVVTPDDRSGVILIVNIIGLIIALSSVAARVYITSAGFRKPVCNKDDAFCLLAMVMSCGRTASLTLSINILLDILHRRIRPNILRSVERIQQIHRLDLTGESHPSSKSAFFQYDALVHRADSNQFAYAIDITYIVGIYCTKLSILFLLMRVHGPYSNLVLRTGLVLTIIAGITSVFVIALKCNLHHPWIQYGAQCQGLVRLVFYIIRPSDS